MAELLTCLALVLMFLFFWLNGKARMQGLVLHNSQGTAYDEAQIFAVLEKPFLLFVGSSFYPDGGTRDYVGAYATVEDALGQLEEQRERIHGIYGAWFWWDVVDRLTMEVVEGGKDD